MANTQLANKQLLDDAVSTSKIVNNAVTLAKLATVAAARFLGSAAGGAVEAMTPAVATSILNAFTTTLQGLVPASGGGVELVLRGNGTWSGIATAQRTPSGDVTIAATLSAYVSEGFEIPANQTLEIGAGAVLEIG